MTLLAAADLLLLLGATLRTVRLIVADDFPGTWLIRRPASDWAARHDPPEAISTPRRLRMQETNEWEPGWREKLVQGLECPYCVGFWIGALILASLWAVGGPGHASEWWRYLTGAFTLNYIVGFTVSRLDGGDDE